MAQDYVEAARWFLKAAEQGEVLAQLELGSMYYDGQGVDQDYAEAGRWYRKAAERGNGRAQFNLGLMCRDGQGVPQDPLQAYMWMSLAVADSMKKNHDVLMQLPPG